VKAPNLDAKGVDSETSKVLTGVGNEESSDERQAERAAWHQNRDD